MSKLKKQRRMCGLTQHEVSRLAGISLNRLVYAETNRQKLTAEEMRRIKQLLSRRGEQIAGAVA